MAITQIGLAGTIKQSALIKVLLGGADAIKRSKSVYFLDFFNT